ncbi:MAG TPA: ABC transporter substrate-binding protein [Candidatus Dormibacteraeota bacterium]|nr:ABC transporter substrate-binding protein [Candidatus Dormibacteraeota bacterium]
MADHKISRETFIKGAGIGTVAAASVGFPAFIPSRGEAADVLRIGLVEEYTGVFAAYAVSETRGAEMALEAWNKRGGVMGRQVQLVKEDCQNDPGVTVQKVRKLINQDKVAAVMGTINSADSLSASNAANSLGTLFMDSGGHTDDVTGKDCHWSTFRTCHSTWMETHATGYAIANKFGKKWYLITPDYAFGHALARGYEDVIKKIGGTIVGNDLTPVGTTDFSPYLTKVAAAKPDCLIVLPQGADFVNCLKQANSFGLLKKIPAAGPQVELEAIWSLPEAARVGYWGVEWYYKGDKVFGKSNPMAEAFVSQYRKSHGEPPTARSCFGYVTLDRMLWAMNEAKSVDPVKVAKKLENARFHSMWEGEAYYRGADHQLMWPMWFASIRGKGTPQDKYDVFDVLDSQPADKIEQSVAEKAKVCHIAYPA